MKTSRRKFFQIAGVAGAGIVGGGLSSCAGANGKTGEMALASIKQSATKAHPQQFNMCGYAAPKLETVRIGFIGLGGRGLGAVRRIVNIEGAEIVAFGDKDPNQVTEAQKILNKHGLAAAKEYSGNEDVWKDMCQSPDIDLVYICTPWSLHTPMAVFAMESGKHAASEVPAAVTLDEAWQLVETSERTKKHCMMLENCCYDFFELLTLNMARQGFFGEIVHVEGAYNHTLIDSNFGKGYSDMWRLRENQHRNGNLYPTHGLGPVCQILNINRGDKMEYLTSLSTNDFQMGKRAAELAAEDDFYKEFATDSYRGNMNNTLVRTNKGKSILIQHDVTSPRPYSRIHLVSGTKGIAQKYPLPGRIAKGHDDWFSAEELKALEEQYTPKIVKLVGEMAKKVGGHGGMDFLMDWRLIDCLRNGIALDQDVYDAALWSAIAPLSEWSVANRSNSIDVPDFTNGAWKTNVPVDITLSQGGTTKMRAAVAAEG